MLSKTRYVFCIVNTILCFCVLPLFAFQPVVLQTWAYGKNGSHFGYSVQLHKDKAYVGAPKENDTGAVYECNYYGCVKLNFTLETNFDYDSLLSDQQLGTTLDTFDNKLVACAPRWINKKYAEHYFMNGVCFIKNLDSAKTEAPQAFIPLMSVNKQGYKDNKGKFYYNYIFGQAGFSIDISKDGYFTMGAPGVLQWLGSIAQYDLGTGNMSAFVPNPAVFFKDIIHPKFMDTLFESEYFGFAVASGNFKNIGRMSVAGSPRGNNLTGQVFIYKNNPMSFNISIQHRFSGREIGEFFGSVLTVGDITGDGYDEILVGSPIFSGRGDETGCIYVFISEERGFSQQIIESHQSKGRFGMAISLIGDINEDGYTDVAIGAPYEDARGVVYVYLGSKKGLVEQPYYRIEASPLNKGFGFSISRGYHQPDSGVTMVAVGAYKSAHIMMIYFRPIIRLTSTLRSNEEKLNFEKITSENFTFSLTACIRFSAKYLTNRKYFFNTTIIADPFYGRVTLHNSTTIIQCKNNETCCNFYPLHIEDNIFSKQFSIKPLEFRFEYNLWGSSKDKQDPEFPEFALNHPSSEILSVPFETDCGDKESCEPELRLDAKWLLDTDTYILGSQTHIDIEINVYNDGDSAYSCFLQIKHYNIPLLSLPERCVQVEQDSLECNVGNPLKAKSNRMFVLQLDPALLEESQMEISVDLNLTSIGIESNLEDNFQTLNLKIGSEYNININSVSKPDHFLFNFTDENTIEIIQQFDLYNQGPSPLYLFTFILSIPNTVENQSSSVEISGIEIMNGEILNTYCDYQLITWQNKYFTMLDSYCKLNNTYLDDWESYKTAFFKCQNSEYGCTQYFGACNGKDVKHISVKITMDVDLSNLENTLDSEEIVVFAMNVMPIVSNKTNENCHEAGSIFIGEAKPTDVFPWIIVGIGSGLLILTILIIVLWKVGFFKRMVLPTAEEVEGIVEDDETFGEELGMEDKM